MIVWRTKLRIRRGRLNEAVALLKELSASLPELTMRINSGISGRTSVVAWEAEYESFEAYDQSMAEWEASPGATPFVEKMGALARGRATHELWDVE